MRIFCHLFPFLVEFFSLLKEKNPRSSEIATQYNFCGSVLGSFYKYKRVSRQQHVTTEKPLELGWQSSLKKV
jgi:hypothetical protein